MENADSMSPDCYSEVASAFHSAVMSGGKVGTPGEPFPQDIEQRDKSAQIAASLPPGSPSESLLYCPQEIGRGIDSLEHRT